jgi:hypothetical protein
VNRETIVMVHTNINAGLRETDDASKAVQKTPHRVSLDSIIEKIEHVDYINPERHPNMTICMITMENGFVVVGKSASADPENFNFELGKKFSYEDAVRQIWPFEGYLLCEKLSSK